MSRNVPDIYGEFGEWLDLKSCVRKSSGWSPGIADYSVWNAGQKYNYLSSARADTAPNGGLEISNKLI